MPKLGSNNPFPSVRMVEQAANPTTPDAGEWRAFFKERGLHYIEDDGSVVGPLGALIGARAYRSGVQSMTNAAVTTIELNAESFDTDSMHDNSTNNTRLTVPTGYGGQWLVMGGIGWASGSGRRIMYLNKNGSNFAFNSRAAHSGSTFTQIFAPVNAAAGDYFEVAGYQDSGGAIDAQSGEAITWLAAFFLGA